MAHHPSNISEDNPNPALRPSVDHLLAQLYLSSVLNRDPETQLYVIEKVCDWFFFRKANQAIINNDEVTWQATTSIIQRLALKLQHVWMGTVTVRSKEWPRPAYMPAAWDEPMPDLPSSVSKQAVKTALLAHQCISEDEQTLNLICSCKRSFENIEYFNKHQRVQVVRALFPESVVVES
jgi:hypothetical protein